MSQFVNAGQGLLVLPGGDGVEPGAQVEISDIIAANSGVASWIKSGMLVPAATWSGNVDQTVADLQSEIADLQAQLAAATAKRPKAAAVAPVADNPAPASET